MQMMPVAGFIRVWKSHSGKKKEKTPDVILARVCCDLRPRVSSFLLSLYHKMIIGGKVAGGDDWDQSRCCC